MNKWYFDVIINNLLIKPFIIFSYIISKNIDRGIIETVGPFGLTTGITNTAQQISQSDTGLVTSYALYIVLGILILILYSNINLINVWEQDNSLFLIFIICYFLI